MSTEHSKATDHAHYFMLKVVKDETQVCLKGLLNYTELKTEIEEAKPTGDLDIVFRKYCK